MKKLTNLQMMSWTVLVVAALSVGGSGLFQMSRNSMQQQLVQVLDLQDRLSALEAALLELSASLTASPAANSTAQEGWQAIRVRCDTLIEEIDTHPARYDALRDTVDRYHTIRQRLLQADEPAAALAKAVLSLREYLERHRLETQQQVAQMLGRDEATSARSGLLTACTLLLILAACGLLALQQRSAFRAAEIERLSRLLAAAVRSTEEGIIISDLVEGRQSRIVFVNESFCRMVRTSREELTGHPLTLFCNSQLGEGQFTVIEQDLQNSKSTRLETIIRRKDGTQFHSDWHMSPVRNSAGEVTHFITTIRDITESKEQQAQLIQSEKMASLGQLASGVAHEINNPIGFAMNELQMLVRDMETFKTYLGKLHDLATAVADRRDAECQVILDELTQFAEQHRVPVLMEDLDEMLASSLEGVERVKVIVKQLKDFARPDDDVLEDTDVNKQVEAALRITGHTLKKKCQVERRYGDLPSIPGHPGQLMQVFTNLLINAEQAIRDHGRITVETGVEASEVVVKISDTGVGIPPEHLPLLFTPFFTTKPIGEGTGLGLSVSYGIISKLNGTISVESRPDEGTTFSVRLPMTQPGR